MDLSRPGDSKLYVVDVSLAEKDFGWKPVIHPVDGVKKLYDWV
jgi:nucleoside-diphosphate-sugar epimerase